MSLGDFSISSQDDRQAFRWLDPCDTGVVFSRPDVLKLTVGEVLDSCPRRSPISFQLRGWSKVGGWREMGLATTFTRSLSARKLDLWSYNLRSLGPSASQKLLDGGKKSRAALFCQATPLVVSHLVWLGRCLAHFGRPFLFSKFAPQ